MKICGHGSGFPSTKDMDTYCANRYKNLAPNGKHKGLVAARRLKNFTDAERQKFHDAYTTILGRNYYSQGLRQYVFKPYQGRFYSDCSSSGCACYAKAGHDVGLLNTAGIYLSKHFEDVPVVIKDGIIQNPNVLKVGDALLFVGNDPNRPLQIGHVEFIYEMPQDWHWVQVGKDWYYQKDGQNKHGWALIKESAGPYKHWYWFDDNGKMATGVLHFDDETYYLMEDGALKGACCTTDNRGVLRVWNL